MDDTDEPDDNPLTPEDVLRAIAVEYAGAERRAVTSALSGYRGPERSRVQVAILVLAGGRAEAVPQYVESANEDYRDVLFWAEWPREARFGTKKHRRERFRALGLPIPPWLK